MFTLDVIIEEEELDENQPKILSEEHEQFSKVVGATLSLHALTKFTWATYLGINFQSGSEDQELRLEEAEAIWVAIKPSKIDYYIRYYYSWALMCRSDNRVRRCGRKWFQKDSSVEGKIHILPSRAGSKLLEYG